MTRKHFCAVTLVFSFHLVAIQAALADIELMVDTVLPSGEHVPGRARALIRGAQHPWQETPGIMTVPEDEILSAKVVYTIIGGQVKHRAESP